MTPPAPAGTNQPATALAAAPAHSRAYRNQPPRPPSSNHRNRPLPHIRESTARKKTTRPLRDHASAGINHRDRKPYLGSQAAPAPAPAGINLSKTGGL